MSDPCYRNVSSLFTPFFANEITKRSPLGEDLDFLCKKVLNFLQKYGTIKTIYSRKILFSHKAFGEIFFILRTDASQKDNGR